MQLSASGGSVGAEGGNLLETTGAENGSLGWLGIVTIRNSWCIPSYVGCAIPLIIEFSRDVYKNKGSCHFRADIYSRGSKNYVIEMKGVS